ncbi:MAG: DNA repair protein RecN [Clostridia bacterium]|nr:DNA repair protein RecN [Clostridia bacterium]MBR0422511.1 DNA repair protein RecN [Clostridia bacterium]
MLRHLTISNIALIDKLSLDFEEGFSALTGETGAGKSILIEAVGLALGERAYRESIRTGAQKGSVEALFTVQEGTPAAEYLLEHELYDGEEVVLYRELYMSGKSVCRINGTLVSAAELKTVGDLLVDMHGQHAHQSLLNDKTHLGLLDAFAESDRDGLLTRMQQERRQALDARSAREKLQSSLKERARRLDVIAYELKEIDSAQLQPGEEEQLETRKKQLQNFAAIEENLQAAYDALYEEQGALNQISEAKRCLSALGEYGEEYQAAAQQTEEAYYSLEDVAYSLRDALNGLSFDPNALDEIESRLYQIEQLKRKYGANIEEILEYGETLRAEQAELLGGEDRLTELEQAEQAAIVAFTADARLLSERRKEGANRLKQDIEANLKDMGMPFASFSAGFSPLSPEDLSETGVDEMSFLFSANKGEPEKPLVRVASGGEISRVMLAFKVALSHADAIDTLIFDEIDTGISGLIANSVAKKMQELSRAHQLLCVTHLAQIAARADRQYYIYKETLGESTRSAVKPLSEEERPAELARIMGSVNDPLAIQHARNLLRSAKEN